MNLVYCTTCKGRTQHLSQTLPANLATNQNPLTKFVVLDYNDQGDLPNYLRSRHARDIESGRLAVYSARQQDPGFRMAHAKNMAHRAGILESGDILVNLDADNYTGPAFDDYVLSHFEQNRTDFMWARMQKDGNGRLPRGISGRIAVTADAFLLAGGYDERYRAWGPDDKDFHSRLHRLGFKPVEIHPGFLNAIMHTDRMRFKEYTKYEVETSDELPEVYESDATVSNFGAIGTGVLFKNFDWDNPISFAPLPTRVFGIGMHKTATTSLHTALTTLGINSAHWKSAHWAKAIYEEMQTWGRSSTLERSYALCDLPIPMLFRQLDAGYPGSKFILTVRDEQNWIESVRLHWSHEHNRFRDTWNHDPFTHRCHKLLYGHKNFNPESMVDRYRRHNAEVLDYFRDRPQDLLVMDMDNGAGWPELCRFLGKRQPPTPYPKAYAHY